MRNIDMRAPNELLNEHLSMDSAQTSGGEPVALNITANEQKYLSLLSQLITVMRDPNLDTLTREQIKLSINNAGKKKREDIAMAIKILEFRYTRLQKSDSYVFASTEQRKEYRDALFDFEDLQKDPRLSADAVKEYRSRAAKYTKMRHHQFQKALQEFNALITEMKTHIEDIKHQHAPVAATESTPQCEIRCPVM